MTSASFLLDKTFALLTDNDKKLPTAELAEQFMSKAYEFNGLYKFGTVTTSFETDLITRDVVKMNGDIHYALSSFNPGIYSSLILRSFYNPDFFVTFMF